MSAPSSSVPSSQPQASGTPSNSVESNSAPSGTTANAFASVVGFNHLSKTLFTGVGTDHILIDHSGSIHGPNALLERTAVAALIKGSNAEGKIVIPKPCGGTAIISAVSACLENKSGDSTIYLFTDGEETCYSGPLIVGKEEDGSPKVEEFFGSSAHRAKLLADHLEYHGVNVCVLGIGAAAQPMVQNMLNRSNVFCAHIDSGADTKAIVSVMRTLKGMTKRTAGSSVTRNGKQHTLLVTLNPEVQESIKNLTPAEMDEFDDVIGNVIVSDSQIVCPSDLKRAMKQVFDNYDEDISGHEKDIKSALLLAMEAMCDEPLPAAMISSKHSAVIGVPQDWRDFRRHCNRLFSQMAKAEIVKREPAVITTGISITVNGNEHKFSSGCAQYSCQVPKSAVTGVAEDEDFCTARSKLPVPKTKKRKREDTPMPPPSAQSGEGSSSSSPNKRITFRASPSSP